MNDKNIYLIFNICIALIYNAMYVTAGESAGGRWFFQFPITSLVVIMYVLLLLKVHKALFKEDAHYALFTTFNIVVMIFAYQYMLSLNIQTLLYLGFNPYMWFIATWPYAVLLGGAVVLYGIIAWVYKKYKAKN